MSYNGEKLKHITYGDVTLVERIYTLGEDAATHAVIELSDGSQKQCPITELSTDNYFYSERYGEQVLHKDHGTLTIVGKELDIESGLVTYKLEKKDGEIVELTGDEIDDMQSDILHQLFFDADGCSYKVLRKEIDLETSENRFILLSEDGVEVSATESDIEENYTKKRQKNDVSTVKKEISELKESVVGEISTAFSELVKTINQKTEEKEQTDKNILKVLKRLLKKDTKQDNTDIIDAITFVQKSVDSIDYNASFNDISRKLAETIVAVRTITESIEKKDTSVNIAPIVNKLEKIQRLIEAFKPFEIPSELLDKDGIRVTLPKRLFTHDGRLKVDVNTPVGGGQMISVGGGSSGSSETSEEELEILREIAENTNNISITIPDGLATESRQVEMIEAIENQSIILSSGGTVLQPPTSVSAIAGTIASGTVENAKFHDSNYFVMNEVSGDGLTAEFTFEMPSGKEIKELVFHGRYEGGGTHNMTFWLYDYALSEWIEVSGTNTAVPTGEIDAFRDIPINNPNFVLGTEAKVRIAHNVTNYINSHALYVDFISLRYQETFTVTVDTSEIATSEKQNEQLAAINSFKIPAYDTMDIAYNGDNTVNTKTYKLNGTTVAVMTYVYSGGRVVRKTLL